MSEWKEYRLGDLGTVITGKTPSAHNPEDWGDNMLFITPSDYRNYRKYATNSERKLSKVGMDRLEKKILPANSILVTCIGSDMGKVVINGEQCVTNQQINAIVPNTSVNNDFLYYRLISIYDTLRMYGGDGTAVPIVNKNDFENIKIEIPQLDEQKRIASILSSLDDKIDLLNRENATLEAMAETLFRQWFIEEAKEDWEEGKLGDYVEIVNGVSYKGEDLQPSEVGMVTLKSFGRNGGFRLDGYKDFCGKYKDTQKLNTGDMVVAHTDITQDAAVIGNPAIVFADERYRVITFSMDVVKVISTTPLISISTLYFLMKSSTFKDHCLGYANGSTVLHLSKKAIPEYEFIIPPKDVINRFNEVASSIVNRVLHNNKQIQTLIHTRDGLLPKLMSNKISI